MEDPKVTQPPAHSIHSPSSMGRIEKCPGSLAACLGIRNPETEAMADGTRKHAEVAAAIRGGAVQSEQLAAMDDDVRMCVEFAVHAIDRSAAEWQNATLDVEKRVSYRTFSGELYFGTADLVITSADGSATIVDWKFGRNPVPAPGNMQLAMYAVACSQMLAAEGKAPKSISAMILQPNISPEPAVWSCIDIEEQTERIRKAISLAHEEDAPLVPGWHCLSCPAYANATCRAIQTASVALGRAVCRPSDPLCIDDIASATEPQLAAWMDAADLAEKFICALRDEVRSRALANSSGSYAGRILQRAKGRLSIDDPTGLYAAMKGEFGTDPDSFMSCGTFSASKISKLAGGSNVDGRKRARENRALELCEKYGSRTADAVRLVRTEGK